MKIILIFSLFIFTDRVVAQALLEPPISSAEAKKRCQPVDLRNKLPPVRNQGKTGWCYAYVAADLASYKTGENISAFDIALNFYDTLKARFFLFFKNFIKRKKTELKEYEKRGGVVSEALNATSRAGLCLESELPSTHDAKDLESLMRLIDDIKLYYDKHAFDMSDEDKRRWAERVICANHNPFVMMFPELDLDNLVDILTKSLESSFIHQMASHACQRRVPFYNIKAKEFAWNGMGIREKPSIDHLVPDSGENFLRDRGWDYFLKDSIDHLYKDKVHELLNEENILSITYDADVLHNADYDAHLVQPDHASTVVGRRWNQSNNRCELLLRNSWGKSCKIYNKAYDCHEGYAWIDEDALMRATTIITYIDKD